MKEIDYFSDEKTTYSITDEHGDSSSITVDKWIADLLQDQLPDVHEWIQAKYNLACEKYPKLSRRERGNAVRERARREAEKSPHFVPLSNLL
jgi:hypothetical protein